MEYFLKSIQKYNTYELLQLYYIYRNKRTNGDHFELYNAYGQQLGRFSTEKAVLDFLDLLKEQDRINAIEEVQRDRRGR